MDNIIRPPKKVDTSAEAKCGRCGNVIYSEVIEEIYDDLGKVVERNRIVRGNFRQKLDENGNPVGAVFPFCDCKR